MILIDVAAELKLSQRLEPLRMEPDATRVFYAKFAQNANYLTRMKEERARIVDNIAQHITSATPHVYFCEDGDLFIVTPYIPTREAHTLMLALGSIFETPVTDDFIEYCEANQHLNRLLLILEEKLEKQRVAQEDVRRAEAARQLEQKRQAILNSGAHAALRDISARRNGREKAEIMLIEDDAFSRKLVENVVGKQYEITSLATADQALTTYARTAPNLLFLDIDLPDVTGHELLAKIMALDPEAHVVMLSGNADRENISKALGIGAKGFVAKPFTRDKLFQYISRCPTITSTVQL